MQKLRLVLDELRVESFEAGTDDTVRGTAHAHGGTCSQQPTCGVASRGQEAFEQIPRTWYACCV
jgi:hypothetical protein